MGQLDTSRVTEQGAFLNLGSGEARMGDAGVVTHTQAPLKPTTEMLTAGARAGGVSVEVAWAIYTTMLKAM
ncbi:MAG: hypothetical protein PW843_21735 [Azospirillaceae bacterium]|nr:hypothetical protein [Azospirillaceae bacterium]